MAMVKGHNKMKIVDDKKLYFASMETIVLEGEHEGRRARLKQLMFASVLKGDDTKVLHHRPCFTCMMMPQVLECANVPMTRYSVQVGKWIVTLLNADGSEDKDVELPSNYMAADGEVLLRRQPLEEVDMNISLKPLTPLQGTQEKIDKIDALTAAALIKKPEMAEEEAEVETPEDFDPKEEEAEDFDPKDVQDSALKILLTTLTEAAEENAEADSKRAAASSKAATALRGYVNAM